jgi:hypothetical protein
MTQVGLLAQQSESAWQLPPMRMQQTVCGPDCSQAASGSQQSAVALQVSPGFPQVEMQTLAALHVPAQQSEGTLHGIPSGAQAVVLVVTVVVVPCPPEPIGVDVVAGLLVSLPSPSWVGPPGSLGPGGISVTGIEPSEQAAAQAKSARRKVRDFRMVHRLPRSNSAPGRRSRRNPRGC